MIEGRIEVICGPMFSGKSRELIRRLQAPLAEGGRVVAFKSHLDIRHDEARIASHDGRRLPCTPVRSAREIIEPSEGAATVGVDEAQFLGHDLIRVCRELATRGARVIVAGLDEDYLGRPFDPIPQIMAIANEVAMLMAVCAVCGGAAAHSQRIVSMSERVLVGARETYEPRCSRCFSPDADRY